MDNERRTLRAFCFTVPNWTVERYDEIVSWMRAHCKYGIVGKEVAPNTGMHHLQGYCSLMVPYQFGTLRRLFVHLEKSRGSASDNKVYCSKSGDFLEVGDLSTCGQGRRTDLLEAASCVVQRGLRGCAADFPETFIKYYRGLERYRDVMSVDRIDKPNVKWFWGATGMGKTRAAFLQFGPENVYIKNNTKWWYGYEQQTCIILDDFDPRSWDIRTVLQLLDIYPFAGEVKGGHVKINSPYIYVTCDRSPEDCYEDSLLYPQLRRRIDVIVRCFDDVFVFS